MLVVQFALRKIPERISAKPIRMQVRNGGFDLGE